MFVQSFSALTPHIRPDALPVPRPTGLRAVNAESDALRAMSRDLGAMKLSERLRDPAGYVRLQRARRESLEALLNAPPSRAVAERAADLICMIAEESSWAAAPKAPFDDESHPEIDLQCAETAVLFGWTRRILGPQLSEISPRIASRMLGEVRSRLFRPALAHEDYPFMRFEGEAPMTVAADLLLSCLLLETEASRCARLIKPMLKLLDGLCGRRGRALAPLTETVSDVAAIADLISLLRRMTRGAMDLTDRLPANDWLDEILFMWIQDGYFNDPAGDGMTPALSGGDIFRVGLTAGDDALTALGAQLFHRNHLPSGTVTGRLMEGSVCAMLEAEAGRPPRLRYAALRNNLLMAARIPGLYCSLHAGGGRGNAGDIALFADGAPVLVDGGRRCAVHSVPVLAGQRQLERPARPCVADFEDREDREIMSIDLTHAYPDACRLHSYQRTVLTLRDEQAIRIVDALTFDEPGTAAFSFVTAIRPTPVSNAVRLGPVRLTWEGALTVSARPLDDSLYQIELTAAEPAGQAFFAFSFERA